MEETVIARVLRPGGRLVASAWSGPNEADIVRFQQTAGSFAPEPPVGGVGPGGHILFVQRNRTDPHTGDL